jgi:hypothetical protein
MANAGSLPLALDVQVHRTRLEIEITNHGPDSVRIWDCNNSWGWGTLALDVASPVQAEEIFALTAKPRIWTRNGPGFIEIPSGGSHLVIVIAGHPEWVGIERIGHLREEALRIRTTLRIPPSPEAETYAVLVGEASSPWREAEPPHVWLFDSA